MTDRPAHRQFCLVAQRWQALAERRHSYFAELYRSGRWRLHYTEEKFLARMRDVAGIRDRWAQIVEVAAAEPAAKVEPVTEAAQVTQAGHRDAA